MRIYHFFLNNNEWLDLANCCTKFDIRREAEFNNNGFFATNADFIVYHRENMENDFVICMFDCIKRLSSDFKIELKRKRDEVVALHLIPVKIVYYNEENPLVRVEDINNYIMDKFVNTKVYHNIIRQWLINNRDEMERIVNV